MPATHLRGLRQGWDGGLAALPVRSGKPFPVRLRVIPSDDPAPSSRLSSAADLCQRQISSAGQSLWELAFCRWPIHGSGIWTRWLARILAVNPPLGIVCSSPGARCEGSGGDGGSQSMRVKSMIFCNSLNSTGTRLKTYHRSRLRRPSAVLCRLTIGRCVRCSGCSGLAIAARKAAHAWKGREFIGIACLACVQL